MNSNSSTSSKGFPLKAFGILLLVALIGVAGAYFYGLSQGRAALGAQKSDYETQLQSAREETQKSKDEVVAMNNRVRLLDAQNSLYRAAVALDRRNFGIANTSLQNAARSLGEVKEAPEVPFARVQSLAATLQKTNINVAVNLQTQRERLLGFAEQMQDLVVPAAPLEAAPSEAPAEDSNTASPAPDGANADSLAPDGGTPPAPDASPQPDNAVSSEGQKEGI